MYGEHPVQIIERSACTDQHERTAGQAREGCLVTRVDQGIHEDFANLQIGGVQRSGLHDCREDAHPTAMRVCWWEKKTCRVR